MSGSMLDAAFGFGGMGESHQSEAFFSPLKRELWFQAKFHINFSSLLLTNGQSFGCFIFAADRSVIDLSDMAAFWLPNSSLEVSVKF